MIYKKIKSYFDRISQSNFKAFISLGFIILMVYAHSLNFQFTALDDYDLIVNKFHVLNRIEKLPTIFKTNFSMSESGVYYRPLVSFTFMIDTILGGKKAFLFHLSNIIYHLIASYLFFVLMNLLIQNKLNSFLLSILFSIHPALSQAVVWIPGRNDSLLFIFLSITIITFIKYSKSNTKTNQQKYIFLLLSILSFLLSLLTKENAFLILIFIVLYQSFFNEDKLKRKDLFIISIAYLIPILIYFILRSQAVIQETEFEQLTLSIVDYIKGIINYTGKIFLPFNLNVITLIENINLIYGIVSIALLSILSLNGIKNIKLFFFGILWFLLFLISGIVGLTGFTNFLDHRLYIPIFGVFLSISQLKIFERIQEKIFALSFVLIMFLFVYLNISHSKNFYDPLTFYQSAVNSAPNSFFVQRGLANVYHRLKNYDKAEEHYLKSIELNPNSVETMINIAINFKKKGDLNRAEFYFQKALRMNPKNSIAYNNLGNLYLQKNKLSEAENLLKRAIELNTNYFEAYNNLGVLYARMEKDTLAYKSFFSSIEINPYFAEGYFNLALFFYNQNKIDSSRYYYNKAIENGFPEENFLRDKLIKITQ